MTEERNDWNKREKDYQPPHMVFLQYLELLHLGRDFSYLPRKYAEIAIQDLYPDAFMILKKMRDAADRLGTAKDAGVQRATRRDFYRHADLLAAAARDWLMIKLESEGAPPPYDLPD